MSIQSVSLGPVFYMMLIIVALLLGCGADSNSEQGGEDGGLRSEQLEQIKNKTASEYAAVKHVLPQDVEQWIGSEEHRPLLLDVREQVEFAVSHLQGAKQVQPDASALSLQSGVLSGLAKDSRIVLYCSVGVRSAAMAKRLQDAGYSNVHNMNGSIFQWANEDRPVYQNGEPAMKVHPYNKKWGKLLQASKRADVPDVDR
jgi:rhodanese-related sulfurtransferase